MYQITFTLKQHTPIIHFQHNQTGATLRATEVKPKLDRFIASVFKTLPVATTHIGAIIKITEANASQKSLYKIKFAVPAENNYFLPLARVYKQDKKDVLETVLLYETKKHCQVIMPTCYFGNEDKVNKEAINVHDLRIAVQTAGLIDGLITCYDGEIASCIKTALPYFFMYENFGTRQSKGFGSFGVETVDKSTVNIASETMLHELFNGVYKKNVDNRKWYEVIYDDYKLLKSGRGAQQGYAKSKLFLHFANARPPIRWEKRFIKKQINNTNFGRDRFVLKSDKAPIDINYANDWQDNQQVNYAFVRALLGLAEQYEFQALPKKLVVKISSNDIQRFKSPILFKVLNNAVYICANELDENHPIYGHQFSMQYYPEGRLRESENMQHVPTVPETFSLMEFLNFALLYDNISAKSEKISGYQAL